MPDSGAASHGRPLCPCHRLPMDRTRERWQCAEKRRARQRAEYHADPAGANYARTRLALTARIARKRAHIEELEDQLHEAQNTD